MKTAVMYILLRSIAKLDKTLKLSPLTTTSQQYARITVHNQQPAALSQYLLIIVSLKIGSKALKTIPSGHFERSIVDARFWACRACVVSTTISLNPASCILPLTKMSGHHCHHKDFAIHTIQRKKPLVLQQLVN
jgi:hypothetical protein